MKKWRLLLFLIAYIIYMEIAFRYFLFDQILNFEIITLIIFSLPIAILFFIIITLFNEKINKILTFLLLLTSTLIYTSQLIFFNIYDHVFSLSSTQQANAVTEFFGFVVEQLAIHYTKVLVLLVPLLLFIIVANRFFSFEKMNLEYQKISIALLITFQLLALTLLNNNSLYSNHQLYYQMNAPTLSVNHFGLLTTMRLDAQRLIAPSTSSPTLVEIVQKEPIEPIIEEIPIIYNEMNIDFEYLINSETNTTLKNMHEYFYNQAPTNQNEWTGKFAGKNLIWILAESFDHIAIDPEITPNLYKIANEGLNFTNFYTPVFLSTIDGEYMTKTGLIPKAGVWSLYRSHQNYIPFSLGNQFRQLDYQTKAYHNGQYTYYRRHLSHPNLGYDYYGCGNGLDINCRLWPQSDLEMIDATIPDAIENDNFMIYYLTISGHLRYNRYNFMANKNWDYVKDLPYSTPVKCYMAQHVELDKAIASLINMLEEANLAEDTVIAISSDHWPYGLTIDELNERATFDRNDFFERDRLPFIIWHKNIEGKEVTKLASTVDILPTLSNMFGLEYDSRLLMGQDIFADTEPIVIFSNHSWITEKGKYHKIRNQFIPNDQPVDKEYIERINQIVYNRFQISRLILDNDYYRKILN